MVSDFSLKALIHDWDEAVLGHNPLVQVGQFDSRFKLRFDSEVLMGCPSAQLQNVGRLCADTGALSSQAMGGTIAYGIDREKLATAVGRGDYKFKVLTVAHEMGSMDLGTVEKHSWSIAGQKGLAGHCLLTYPTGGTLLTSCGHWIELVKVDTSIERLVTVASDYGAAFSAQVAQDYAQCADAPSREACIQRYSAQMVQSSTPCKRTPC